MKKLLGFVFLMVLMTGSALGCHLRVHTTDSSTGNDLPDVDVTVTDGQMTVGNDDTDANGYTDWFELVHQEKDYWASGVKEGYECETVKHHYVPYTWDTVELRCTPSSVPEFGTVGAAAALLGAGLVVFKKRK